MKYVENTFDFLPALLGFGWNGKKAEQYISTVLRLSCRLGSGFFLFCFSANSFLWRWLFVCDWGNRYWHILRHFVRTLSISAFVGRNGIYGSSIILSLSAKGRKPFFLADTFYGMAWGIWSLSGKWCNFAGARRKTRGFFFCSWGTGWIPSWHIFPIYGINIVDRLYKRWLLLV